MTQEMELRKNRFGLALSGGGYRAAVYHLGTFAKLKELGLLDKVDVISSNSGGSITAGAYGLFGDDYKTFYNKVYNGVQRRNVIKGALTSLRILLPLLLLVSFIVLMIYLLFTSYSWVNLVLLPLIIFIIGKYQYQLLPFGLLNEKMYDRYFFEGSALSKMNKDIDVVINSTNLETGDLFIFSQKYMGDSGYTYNENRDKTEGVFNPTDFPVSRAVAASSCVPFAFSPIKIHVSFFNNSADINKFNPVLVDGGVYDNQGGHRLTHPKSYNRCDFVLVSDAGNKLPFKNVYSNVFALLIRTMDVFMDRVKSFQIAHYLYTDLGVKGSRVAYQSLGWDLEKSIPKFVIALEKGNIDDRLIDAHQINREWIKTKDWDVIKEHLERQIKMNEVLANRYAGHDIDLARSVGTNLTPLSKKKIDALISHSAQMTELQLKLFHPWLIK